MVRNPRYCKSIPSGTFNTLRCSCRWPLTGCSFQGALRAFFQPIKTDDPRLDFYTVYKREATEYDADYVKNYDEDLNTTLIFVRRSSSTLVTYLTCPCRRVCFLPSAPLSSLMSIRTSNPIRTSKLWPSSAPSSSLSISPPSPVKLPPVREDPPRDIVIVTCLMYTSLMISLLAAFVAMLGKQWLNRYLRNSGGSMIERCGDRQRKCDGLEKWPLYFFVESLPVMLQVSLLLLACGLCRYMWSISASVAYALISLTGLGVIFYIAVVIAGMSSYACPFQTPVSIALRGSWKKVRHGTISIVRTKRVLSRTRRMWNRRVRPLLRRQSLPTIPLENVQIQQSESVAMPGNASQSKSLSTFDDTSRHELSSTLEPWLKPRELGIIRRTNARDVGCVSWILRNITDPEVLDATIRLAGEIRWFENGMNVDLPYDLIVSTFEACFDSTGTLYPGSRDRAYYSGRAMLWIHALARCKSGEFASMFPLRGAEYKTLVPDSDLGHLLRINLSWSTHLRFKYLFYTDQESSPSHSQWISNLLLHYSWASRAKLDHEYILYCVSRTHNTRTTIPLNATLNHLLVWCTFLGSPVEEEALKVQDKSYDTYCFCFSSCSLLSISDRTEPILDQVFKAVLSAINGTCTQQEFIPHMLRDLAKLENHPKRLTEIAYGWCSVMCGDHRGLQDRENLLLVCLEIGFRHLDFRRRSIEPMITHAEHHRGLVDVVFKSQESEVIADLLQAWTAEGGSHEPAHELLGFCVGHLVCLHNLVPFSSRLRQLVIRSVELIGYEGLKGVGVERFIGLLNHLHVTAEDIGREHVWARLLLDAIQSSEGTQHLSYWYWESLAELAVSESWWLRLEPAHSLQIITSLTEAKEWSKLECWVGIVWMLLPWEANAMVEGVLGRSMLLLFRQQPGAVKKLEKWMERWGGNTQH